MDGANDLRITNFIAHVINHHTGSLELIDLETPVDDEFPHEFFGQYIRNALDDPLHRRARFRDPSGVVSRTLSALRKNKASFVEASQEIASHLYNVMSGSRYKEWIKPGDVMLALVRNGEEKDKRPHDLAILKIDPSDAVIREVEGRQGRRRVVFRKREDRLPTAKENNIQKIALVYGARRSDPEPHDILLLDKNIKERGVAHFFYDDFLQSFLNRSGREISQTLLDGVKHVVSHRPDVVTPPLTPRERIAIVDRATALLQVGAPVVIEDFAAEVAGAARRRKAQTDALGEALAGELRTAPGEPITAGESLPVDAAEAERRAGKTVYRLEGGVRISGDTGQVRERVQISEPDAGGVVTVTIRTRTLEIL